MSTSVDKDVDLQAKLKEYFGYDSFRGNQEAIIKNLLSGRDTMVIMPTGAGKSMCYQLPATLHKGTAIVVSPLIALMKNQVDQMRSLGIHASYLNSTLSKTDMNRVKENVISGKTILLYVAPESLTKEENIEMIKKANISFVAIDEVHCISEWGHDFRPEYRRIKSIIAQIGEFPVIALTATATPKVQQDIQKNLHMEDADLYKSSFRRANLFYEVRPKVNAKMELIQFLQSRKGEAGIIYCLSRKKVEEMAEFLNVNGIQAAPYHAGLESSVRMKNQDDFLNEDLNVVVATIAFGMGIDKPDVRFVVHYDAPKSLEGYYQETGRAGRDGKMSHCLMFYSYNDILKLEKFNKDKSVSERDNARMLLEEVTSYAESSTCRTRQLLHYFGEHIEEDCGECDNCKNPPESREGMKDVQLVLETIRDTKQKFGIKHIVDVLTGKENQYVRSYEHHKLKTFGAGKEFDAHYWMRSIRQITILDYLVKDMDHFGVYLITKWGDEFLANPVSVMLTKDHEYPELTESQEEAFESSKKTQGSDQVLFKILKELRKRVAKEKKFPPYVIFQEESLEDMATFYPQDIDSLTHMNGVGMGKAKKFGKPFVDAIKQYVEENDVLVPSDMYVKQKSNKSKNKIFIIQQVDKKTDLEEIAVSLGMSFDNLIEEMEHISHSGTKLNIDYYLEDRMDEEVIDDIYDYFMEAEGDDFEDALDELGEEYEESDIKLVHIKFISEVAN